MALLALGGACSAPSPGELERTTPEGHPLLSPEVFGDGNPAGEPPSAEQRGMSANTLPAQVDHSAGLPRVRHQGDRGTCMAFAATAMIEAYYGLKTHLSVEQTAQRLGNIMGFDFQVTSRLTGYRVAEERSWPYGGSPAANLSAESRWGIDEMRATGNDPEALKRALAENPKTTVWAGLVWDSEVIKGPVLDRPNRSDLEISVAVASCLLRSNCGGHAVLLVGYERRNDPSGRPETYFKFRNSWGEGWGYGGYGYASGAFLRAYAKAANMIVRAPTVSAAPSNPTPLPPSPPTNPPTGATPRLEILAPRSGAVLPAGPVTVKLNASDGKGHAVKVRLLVDGHVVTDEVGPPYGLVAPALSAGRHELKVVARDAAGTEAEAMVTVTIEAGGVAPAPVPPEEQVLAPDSDESASGCSVPVGESPAPAGLSWLSLLLLVAARRTRAAAPGRERGARSRLAR
ncbi:MAG: hypothetical protein IT371_00370 [Deltaproteobacteria bacterium]|nr:hypothetical protein [Deltaproteobacteria bacterium]